MLHHCWTLRRSPDVHSSRIEIHWVCCCCYVTLVVSDSVQAHRRQPTRLPCPWDSPGKNTGVGCHFLLQCMKVKSESEIAQRPHGLQPTRLLCPWDFPGKNTGRGCHYAESSKYYYRLWGLDCRQGIIYSCSIWALLRGGKKVKMMC